MNAKHTKADETYIDPTFHPKTGEIMTASWDGSPSGSVYFQNGDVFTQHGNDCEIVRPKAMAEINRLKDINAELLGALESLACLGNGDSWGNSDGNLIAQSAIKKAKGE